MIAYISLAISIILGIFTIITFVKNDKKDTINDKKEQYQESGNQKLIDYRLTKVEEKLDQILNKFDTIPSLVKEQVKEQIAIEMQNHINMFHNKNRKGD